MSSPRIYEGLAVGTYANTDESLYRKWILIANDAKDAKLWLEPHGWKVICIRLLAEQFDDSIAEPAAAALSKLGGCRPTIVLNYEDLSASLAARCIDFVQYDVHQIVYSNIEIPAPKPKRILELQ